MGGWRLLGVGLVLAAGWGMLVSYQATHVPRYHLDLTPADLHLPYESLTLTAADGVQLAAWRLIPPSPRGVVFVQHGYGTCRADPLHLAALIYRGGYAVVSVDFRGHGESGGRCSFGQGERLDLRAALDAIAADPRLQYLPVGYFGISMGAAIGILMTAEEPRLRAIVSDSSYARFGPMVSRYQWLAYYLPEVPFGWITRACVSLRLGAWDRSLDPVHAIGKIAPRAVLIIHGDADASIPVRHARELYAAARDPKELWVIPGAAHVSGLYHAETEYAQRVLGFFARNLGAA